MEKRSLFIIFMLLSNILFAQSYIIEGKIEGAENQNCYFGYYFGEKQYVSDTVTTSNEGYFKFTGEEVLDHGIYLIVMEDMSWIEIIITSNAIYFEADKNDVLSTIVFTNSQDNTEFYRYQNFIKALNEKSIPLRESLSNENLNKEQKEQIESQMEEMGKTVREENEAFITNHPNNFFSKVLLASEEVVPPNIYFSENEDENQLFKTRFLQQHYLDNLDFNDKRMLRTPIFHKRIDFYVNKLTYQKPDSVIQSIDFIMDRVTEFEVFKYLVNYFTSTYERSKIMGMDEVFVHMVYKYILSEKVTWIEEAQLFKIKDRADKLYPVLIGKIATNFTMKDNKAKYQSLHGLISDYTILCFYDPDCGHCKTEVPMLKGLKERLSQKKLDVQIVAVNVELEPEKWHNFIKEEKLEDWIHLENFDLQSNFRQYYDIYKTPEILLLDKNKKILAKRLGVEQLEDFFNKQILTEHKLNPITN